MEVVFIDGTAVPLNFRILFVPLNWAGNQADFDAAAQNEVNLFANSTTLGGCMNTIEVVTLEVTTQNFNTFTCNNNDCRLSSIRDFLRDNGINAFQYDVVVGLLPAGGSPCAPAVGCSNTIDTVWVEDDVDPIIAHEIGHIYGLEDEYCSEEAGGDQRCAGAGDINPLDAALNCNPNTGMGCCNCPKPLAPPGSDACGLACDPAGIDNYFVCCDGNDGAL